jgi:hypothetical protein
VTAPLPPPPALELLSAAVAERQVRKYLRRQALTTEAVSASVREARPGEFTSLMVSLAEVPHAVEVLTSENLAVAVTRVRPSTRGFVRLYLRLDVRGTGEERETGSEEPENEVPGDQLD